MTRIDGLAAFAAELEEFADDLDDIADDIVDQAIDEGVKETALQVEATASRLAPVFDHPHQGTGGQLRADLQAFRIATALFSVGSTRKYAPPTEYGSRPHSITPNGPYPLHFVNESGQEIFTFHVDHPGTPAQPFLRPALNHHRSDLVDNISDEIRRVIRRHT